VIGWKTGGWGGGGYGAGGGRVENLAHLATRTACRRVSFALKQFSTLIKKIPMYFADLCALFGKFTAVSLH
jgi:hypothetical protein